MPTHPCMHRLFVEKPVPFLLPFPRMYLGSSKEKNAVVTNAHVYAAIAAAAVVVVVRESCTLPCLLCAKFVEKKKKES